MSLNQNYENRASVGEKIDQNLLLVVKLFIYIIRVYKEYDW